MLNGDIFFSLILTHFISDFGLQGIDNMGTLKYGLNRQMLGHISITLACLILTLIFWHLPSTLIFNFVLVVGATHLATDIAKAYINRRLHLTPSHNLFWALIGLDQALHIVVLHLACSAKI